MINLSSPSYFHLQHRFLQFVAAMALMVNLVAGCRAVVQFEDIYTKVSEPTLQAGNEIPLPHDPTILTVTGKIGAANDNHRIVMDRVTIERVGEVEYSANDPFEERPVLYRGVLMRDLLKLWQVDPNAQSVHLVALNDYVIDIPITDFQNYPVLFALQADGVYMQPDYRGPAMLVYPVDHYEFDALSVQAKWIWQIKAIDVQ
ncbi:MAG: molybdopterin-dependent oxidoreductase [Caldilineaceae bacterium]